MASKNAESGLEADAGPIQHPHLFRLNLERFGAMENDPSRPILTWRISAACSGSETHNTSYCNFNTDYKRTTLHRRIATTYIESLLTVLHRRDACCPWCGSLDVPLLWRPSPRCPRASLSLGRRKDPKRALVRHVSEAKKRRILLRIIGPDHFWRVLILRRGLDPQNLHL